mmetsp:Transcript_16752/g.39474  ORF Transcript_16752/g.39474 Transcript_16752/m.39474 type:complete len:257 (+) Transcript_16752:732-1502(+)
MLAGAIHSSSKTAAMLALWAVKESVIAASTALWRAADAAATISSHASTTLGLVWLHHPERYCCGGEARSMWHSPAVARSDARRSCTSWLSTSMGAISNPSQDNGARVSHKDVSTAETSASRAWRLGPTAESRSSTSARENTAWSCGNRGAKVPANVSTKAVSDNKHRSCSAFHSDTLSWARSTMFSPVGRCPRSSAARIVLFSKVASSCIFRRASTSTKMVSKRFDSSKSENDENSPYGSAHRTCFSRSLLGRTLL